MVVLMNVMLFILSVKECRADDSRVVAESTGAEKRLLVVVLGVALFLDYLSERTEKVLALVRNSAADAENIGLEDVDDIYKTRSEVAEVLVKHLLRVGIARRRSVKCGLAVYLVDVAVCNLEHIAEIELF